MPQLRAMQKLMNGYLVSVTTETQAKNGGEVVKTKTVKTPVMDMYDATVLYTELLNSAPREIQVDMVKKWLTSMSDGVSTPKSERKLTRFGVDTFDEYWYEPWNAQQRDDYEKAVGLQKAEPTAANEDVVQRVIRKLWPFCEECEERHNPEEECPEEEDDDDGWSIK